MEGTPGHEPPPALAPRAGEPCFDKTFFSAFSSPGLGEALDRTGVRELIVCGVHLHGCVRATALDAYARGLRVLIASDATGSYDGLHAAVSRRWLGAREIAFVSVASLTGRAGVAGGGRGTADRAAAAARRARAGWAAAPAAERAAVLARAAELVERRSEELARAIVGEVGKPIHYARAEVARGAALLRAAAAMPEPPVERGEEARTRRVPVGVVAQITPWNNPLAIPLGKLAPALRLGNAVVWKPSPKAPRIAHAVGDLLLEAGAPPGLVSIVEGAEEAAAAVCEASEVAAVSVTGSSAAGYAAQAICARRRIAIQAELGGNNAAIVWSDCDLDAAASAVAEAAFGSAGQRCTANRRVVVAADRFDDFAARLVAATASLPLGDPADPATRVGPLVDEGAADRVAAVLARAEEDGAGIVRPGGAGRIEGLAEAARYLEPAIVLDAAPDSEIVQRESFGPVLVVQRAGTFEEALELLNGVHEGLVAALFSSSSRLQESFLGGCRGRGPEAEPRDRRRRRRDALRGMGSVGRRPARARPRRRRVLHAPAGDLRLSAVPRRGDVKVLDLAAAHVRRSPADPECPGLPPLLGHQALTVPEAREQLEHDLDHPVVRGSGDAGIDDDHDAAQRPGPLLGELVVAAAAADPLRQGLLEQPGDLAGDEAHPLRGQLLVARDRAERRAQSDPAHRAVAVALGHHGVVADVDVEEELRAAREHRRHDDSPRSRVRLDHGQLVGGEMDLVVALAVRAGDPDPSDLAHRVVGGVGTPGPLERRAAGRGCGLAADPEERSRQVEALALGR